MEPGKFNSADYFALQGDAGSALGADLIGSDTISVAPGKTAAKTITVEPNATALGFVALIREPGGRNWRTTKSVSPGSKFTINVNLGKGGVVVLEGRPKPGSMRLVASYPPKTLRVLGRR